MKIQTQTQNKNHFGDEEMHSKNPTPLSGHANTCILPEKQVLQSCLTCTYLAGTIIENSNSNDKPKIVIGYRCKNPGAPNTGKDILIVDCITAYPHQKKAARAEEPRDKLREENQQQKDALAAWKQNGANCLGNER